MKTCHLLLTTLVALAAWQPQARAQAIVDLGSASGFAILAGSAIDMSAVVTTATIKGDIGSFPTAAISGLGNVTLLGINHAGDSTTQSAKSALSSAYSDAAGRPGASTIATELGGTILTPGIYNSVAGTFGVTGNLTLSGSGVYIFQTVSTLITAGSSQILLTNGAQASNVFWQVGTSATLGISSIMEGSVLANTSITLGAGSTVDGPLMAIGGAVTLGDNVSVSSVPEPATTALLLAGLSGVLAGYRRVKRFFPVMKVGVAQ